MRERLCRVAVQIERGRFIVADPTLLKPSANAPALCIPSCAISISRSLSGYLFLTNRQAPPHRRIFKAKKSIVFRAFLAMLRAKFAPLLRRLPLHNGIDYRSPDMRNNNLSGVIRFITSYSRGGESC